MPSEKEIEEAIDWIKNEEFGAVGNSHTYTLIDAYLSMKSDLERVAPDCEILPKTREALSLLDSPRPRPKVSRELYTLLSIWTQGGTYKVDEILNEYGFDVED
jgi:hypothetical protein